MHIPAGRKDRPFHRAGSTNGFDHILHANCVSVVLLQICTVQIGSGCKVDNKFRAEIANGRTQDFPVTNISIL